MTDTSDREPRTDGDGTAGDGAAAGDGAGEPRLLAEAAAGDGAAAGAGPAAADDGPLDEEERAALARWQGAAPPDDFAARVAAMAAGAAPPVRRRRVERRPWLVGGVGVAVAAVVVALVWPSSVLPPLDVPVRSVASRESIELGGRGVAVAEPGTRLGWTRTGAAVSVVQDAGDVFYRVEHGGPFSVITPAGQVEVTGTCFRVEVQPMLSKQAIIGAAAGAVVATAAVVTVYEGKVRVVGADGHQAEVAAGEQARLEPPVGGGGPTAVAVRAAPTAEVALPAGPAADISRADLLIRDKAQREQIAMLATRVKQLEGVVAGGGGGGRHGDGDEADWIDPSRDQLLAWAKECRVHIDLPPVMRGEPMRISPDTARAAGLSAAELAAANQVFVDLTADWKRRVRAWYVEATGDLAGADQLSAHAMGQELQDKAAPGEPAAVQQRLSHERAGLVAPPPDLSRLSPFDRYFRALADLGNEAERLLAAKVGAERAHRIRTAEGGWPMRMAMAGCADEDGAASQDADADEPRGP